MGEADAVQEVNSGEKDFIYPVDLHGPEEIFFINPEVDPLSLC
jgi:hypothetical protein